MTLRHRKKDPLADVFRSQQEEIKKYNITYVLFPDPGNKNNSSILQKAENLLQKTFFKNMDLHILSEDLTKFKMHKVYDDGSYVIYKK